MFQGRFTAAESCRVCVVAAECFDGMNYLPNLAPNDRSQYYSGSLIECSWGEDRFGSGKVVILDQQYPSNFIQIASDGSKEALKAIVGNGDGSWQNQQTIFIRCRHEQTTIMHALYGNWAFLVGQGDSRFYIWCPLSGGQNNKAALQWGTGLATFTLPANLDFITEYVWCFTVGPRGMECWRDGILLGSSANYPALDVDYREALQNGPAVCEGYYGVKGGGYTSGMMNFKALYTFERQLEQEEIQTIFDNFWGLVTPPKLQRDDWVGPLNNRIEITTPVEITMALQEPSQSVADVVIAAVTEILTEIPSPSQSAVDVVELTQAEVLAAAQEPSQSAQDAVEPVPAEIGLEVPDQGATAADSVTATPVEIVVEVQSTGNTVLDEVVTQAVEALLEIPPPELEVSDDVTVEPVPISIGMLVQPLSLTDIVSVITEAAEVIFSIGRIDITTEDDVFYTHKQAIHNKIVEKLNEGIFLPVTYDKDTKQMIVPEDEEDAVPPASVATNELTCLFGLPERNRRERIMERGSWRWQVIVRFHREVVAEVFEEALLASPILIEPDSTKNLRRITLHLENAEYTHPPSQSSSSGTQVIYTFEARLGPV